ncbi:hypothetical protein BU16DRAFT_591981 [Lophium mytilinum]|uniref:Uncharacterized protein n=1 Tax=Lophium mytilinum TaxID=390894 RepID=A0A6A6QM15_9PEZI|nr:hypothetical protein BU16DRAFT_591981 [Lophium mytilinum]
MEIMRLALLAGWAVVLVRAASGLSLAANTSTLTLSSANRSYVNPWVGNYSGTVAPSGTGSLYAAQCQNKWYRVSSYTDYLTTVNSTSVWTTETIRSVTVTEVHTYYTTSEYTFAMATLDLSRRLRQQHLRLHFRPQLPHASTTVVFLAPGASFVVVAGTTTSFPSPVTAQPTITIGTEKLEIVSTVIAPYKPHCNTDAPTCTPGAACTIDGGDVRLFYFPPQTNVSRDMCATAPVGRGIPGNQPFNTTWTPITTGPYTVLPGNTTWYSGNVYVSLQTIGAYCRWSSQYLPVGQTGKEGKILTMAPSDVFSLRATPYSQSGGQSGIDFGGTQWPFNYADLQDPVPWSAWDGFYTCVFSRCSEISGSYNPILAVPAAVRSLDPRWASCDLALEGLYDPPWAVTPVGNFFPSTTAKDPGSPSATPSPGPPQSFNIPTNTPPKPPSSLSGIVLPSSIEPGNSGNPSDPGDPGTPSNTPNPGIPKPQSSAAAGIPPVTTSDPSDPGKNNNPPPSVPTTLTTIGGQPIVPNPNTPGILTIGGTTTLAPGDPSTVISGTTLSLPDPTHLIIGSTTLTLPSPTSPPLTIGALPLLTNPQNPGIITIGDTTLSVNGPGAVTSGTSNTLLDPSHILLSSPTGISALSLPGATPSGAVFTAPKNAVLTATYLGSSVVVAGITLSVGGPALTLPGGLVVSDAPSGLVVAGSTIGFSALPEPSSVEGAVVTLGGQVYTVMELAGGSVVVAGTTLWVGGPAATVGGMVVSEAGTGLVVGGVTVPFETVGGPSKTGAAQFTGRAGRRGAKMWGIGVSSGVDWCGFVGMVMWKGTGDKLCRRSGRLNGVAELNESDRLKKETCNKIGVHKNAK